MSDAEDPFDYDKDNNPLCVHGYKVIEIRRDDITLGNEVAHCRYKRRRTNFDPFTYSDGQICRNVCSLARQNQNIEKIGIEKAKAYARYAAKFSYDLEMAKLKQDPRGYLRDNDRPGFLSRARALQRKYKCENCDFETNDNQEALAHMDKNNTHYIPA